MGAGGSLGLVSLESLEEQRQVTPEVGWHRHVGCQAGCHHKLVHKRVAVLRSRGVGLLRQEERTRVPAKGEIGVWFRRCGMEVRDSMRGKEEAEEPRTTTDWDKPSTNLLIIALYIRQSKLDWINDGEGAGPHR